MLFWLLAWGINYGSVMARGMEDPQYLPLFARALAGLAYWISPKPIDSALILFNTLDAHQHFEKPAVFTLLESGQAFSPTLSILSSLGLMCGLLALSATSSRRWIIETERPPSSVTEPRGSVALHRAS